MDATVSVHDVAHLTHFKGKGCFFKGFLHLSPPKTACSSVKYRGQKTSAKKNARVNASILNKAGKKREKNGYVYRAIIRMKDAFLKTWQANKFEDIMNQNVLKKLLSFIPIFPFSWLTLFGTLLKPRSWWLYDTNSNAAAECQPWDIIYYVAFTLLMEPAALTEPAYSEEDSFNLLKFCHQSAS